MKIPSSHQRGIQDSIHQSQLSGTNMDKPVNKDSTDLLLGMAESLSPRMAIDDMINTAQSHDLNSTLDSVQFDIDSTGVGH